MRPGRVLARAVSELVALGKVWAPPAAGFRVLLYHAVGSKIAEDSLGIYTIAPELFRQHVDALAAYPGKRYAGLADGLPGEGLRIAVSFDDGYKDNLRVAAPMLVERGIPFTVFISTGFVRDRDPNYLSPEEVRELGALPGVTLGTHGVTHIPLAQCDDATLKIELSDSKRYLEDLLGKPVTTMSYPHGAVDQRVRAAVEAAGYAHAGCSRFDINAPERDPLLLCRTDILGIDSVRVFRQKLHGDWDWYRNRSLDPALVPGGSTRQGKQT